MSNHTFNPLSWSVSRGRDTYGYNICRLDSGATGKRYRCSGGGYDMKGTVLGDLLTAEFQPVLAALFHPDNKGAQIVHGAPVSCGYDGGDRWQKIGNLYGLTFDREKGIATIDGACGVSSVVTIAAAIGVSVTSSHDRKGNTNGFFLSW